MKQQEEIFDVSMKEFRKHFLVHIKGTFRATVGRSDFQTSTRGVHIWRRIEIT